MLLGKCLSNTSMTFARPSSCTTRQLNAMLTEGIIDPGYFTDVTKTHTLTVAGVRDVSVEITDGLRIDRHDLRSTHEDDDILFAQHAISLSLLGKYVRVVCDDTDVFVLLVHYYNNRCKCSNSAPMIISSPAKERAVIYFRATVESHSNVIAWHRQGNGCQSCQEGVFPTLLHW